MPFGTNHKMRCRAHTHTQTHRNYPKWKEKKWWIFVIRIGWKSLTHFMLWNSEKKDDARAMRLNIAHNNYDQQSNKIKRNERTRLRLDNEWTKWELWMNEWKLNDTHDVIAAYKKKWRKQKHAHIKFQLSWARCCDTFHRKFYGGKRCFISSRPQLKQNN